MVEKIARKYFLSTVRFQNKLLTTDFDQGTGKGQKFLHHVICHPENPLYTEN